MFCISFYFIKLAFNKLKIRKSNFRTIFIIVFASKIFFEKIKFFLYLSSFWKLANIMLYIVKINLLIF